MHTSLTLIFLVIAIVLFWLSGLLKKGTGLPSIQVAYQDTLRGEALHKPLFDKKLRLTGRPDYLVRDKGEMVPVEVKMRKAPRNPFDSHIMQLAAYCKLVETEYGRRPSYGIIRYSDKSFNVPFTEKLENQLLLLMEDMRMVEQFNDVHRSHDHMGRCQSCGYGEICEEKL
jgi:CRISPR-associated exonuclease Cas4